MRLLDTTTCQFVDKSPKDTVYAILSHTWDIKKGEQSYEELKNVQQRYPPQPRASQNHPSGPSGRASYSQGHGPPAALPPLQPPRDSLSATVHPSRSWFTRRTARARVWYQRCLTPRAPRTEAGTHPSARTPINTPSADDAPTPSGNGSNDSSAPVPGGKSEPLLRCIWVDPELSPKIRDACAVAQANGYRYIWIDSCCIDKSSSSELSEAVNSMYKWYGLADVCYAYLADVPPGEDHQAQRSRFRRSRWFTRGWTLQELIAPRWVIFLAKDWTPIGSKHALDRLVESITKIDYRALLRLEPLDKFSIAQRLSWAAKRETTREEDRAYSLLGIFDIHMPTLYGEGDRAFRRVQEQIMQRIPDESLFAWGEVYRPRSWKLPPNPAVTDSSIFLPAGVVGWNPRQSPFAVSPGDFEGSGHIAPLHDTTRRVYGTYHHHAIEYTSTPYGIRAQFQMIPLTCDLLCGMLGESLQSKVHLQLLARDDPDSRWYLAILGCEHAEYPGHLLGRVCYIPPSESGVELVYARYIKFGSMTEYQYTALPPDLFPLSPETVEHCRPHIETKTVYMPHPNSDPADLLRNLRRQSYVGIKLALLRETRDALHSQLGYTTDLREPDPDHPTTHWLALSNDEHTIIVKFEHTLEDNGNQLTISAAARFELSGSRFQLDSDSIAYRHAVYWTDVIWGGWQTVLDRQRVWFGADALRAAELPQAVDLCLHFAGSGVYTVSVDILSDAPSASGDTVE